MSRIPSMPYDQVIVALQRNGWNWGGQKGNHVRLNKRTPTELLKLAVPAHRPLLRTTLARILKQANLTVDEFLELT